MMSSPDLVREIASYLIDDVPSLLNLTVVSKPCHTAILETPRLWQAACQYRWRSKWGFAKRWITATELARANQADGAWWRDRYMWQEKDAKRQYITPEELNVLTFDFRFWLSQHWGAGNVLASGLRWATSQNFTFRAPPPTLPAAPSAASTDAPSSMTPGTPVKGHSADPNFLWPGRHHGPLYGHPSGRDDLQWFLDDDGIGLQWGLLPELFPKGYIRRLETWGWEVRNCNVVMRAQDWKFSLKRRKRQDGSQETVSSWTSSSERVMVEKEDLWADYIASMGRNATDFGLSHEGVAYLEAPPDFWDFPVNRQRFPRLGKDGIDVSTLPTDTTTSNHTANASS
eukprot:Nitzschia sp. Nitz4//scaffold77_size91520//9342//10367//NITZ4_004877-RA/size91520-processed-gene-0.22-mRNA-1//1//CDS//3329557952//3081//frame0